MLSHYEFNMLKDIKFLELLVAVDETKEECKEAVGHCHLNQVGESSNQVISSMCSNNLPYLLYNIQVVE